LRILPIVAEVVVVSGDLMLVALVKGLASPPGVRADAAV
jgi:hypothetical protein